MKKTKIMAVIALMLAFMMLTSACGGGDIDQQLAEIAKNNQKVESNDKEADKAEQGYTGGLFGGLFGGKDKDEGVLEAPQKGENAKPSNGAVNEAPDMGGAAEDIDEIIENMMQEAGDIQQEAEQESEPEVQVPDGPIAAGHWKEHTYINDYIPCGIEVPADWIIRDADELNDLDCSILELDGAPEIIPLMDAVGFDQFIDALVISPDGQITVNLLYTRLDQEERERYATMNENEIMDELLGSTEMLISSYADNGIMVDYIEPAPVYFQGREHIALKTVGTLEGRPYYITQLFFYNIGECGVTLTVSTIDNDYSYEIFESMFY